MAFDPDAFLKESGSSFDPDAFLGTKKKKTLKQAVFPRASEANNFGSQVVGGMLDAASLPGRFVASGGLSPMGPNLQSMAQVEGQGSGFPGFVDNMARDPALIPSMAVGGPALGMAQKAFGPGLRALGAMGGAEGTLSAGIHQTDRAIQGKPLQPGMGAAEVAGSIAMPFLPGIVNKGVGRLASGLAGPSEEALRTYGLGFGKGAKALEKNAGKQNEIGLNLVDAIDNAHDYMPEKGVINEALSKSSDIDIRPVLEAFEQSKFTPLGPMKSQTPGMIKTNAAIDTYANAIRGTLPTDIEIAKMDFGGDLKAAREALADPESKWGILSGIAKNSAKAAEKAENAASRATLSASKAAGKFGAAPKETLLPQYDKSGKRLYENWASPIFGIKEPNPKLGSLLENARQAASKAKDALKNARAKRASGLITEGDANAALSELNQAQKQLYLADATNEVFQGKTVDEVSRHLVDKYNLYPNEIKSIVGSARSNVAKTAFSSEPPKYTMSATEFRRLRQAMDRDIDFMTPEGKAINEALKGPRATMKNALIAAAPPEYKSAMKSYSDKLQKVDEIKGMLGKTGQTREQRAEGFIANLYGKNKTERQRLVGELGGIFGDDFLSQAKLAKLADELGPEGKSGWIPTQMSGRSGLGVGGGLGAAGLFHNPYLAAPALLASPKIAAGTLGTLDALQTIPGAPVRAGLRSLGQRK